MRVTRCSCEAALLVARGPATINLGPVAAFFGPGEYRAKITVILLLGVAAGILVSLLGIGGGIVLVPAMVHVLHMDQHLAQGTSLLILLPPIGLGALRQYWKAGHVDLRAGIFCAVGMVFGAYLGGRIAVPLPTATLKGLFGGFLMFSAVLLWMKTKRPPGASVPAPATLKEDGA